MQYAGSKDDEMAITEEARHRLFQKLEATIGLEEATILMEHLPPVGWAEVATKRDLDHLRDQIKLDLELGLKSQLRWTLGYVTVLIGAFFAAANLS